MITHLPPTRLAAAYLSVAETSGQNLVHEHDPAVIAAELPPLDHTLLKQLVRHADEGALKQPRRSWALLAVAEAAARHQDSDPLLRGLTAWHLARAANAWVRPDLVAEALARARPAFAAAGAAGWLAACDWQENALPWTRTHFQQVTVELTGAIAGMEAAELTEWLPDARLSLAYAQLLTGSFDAADHEVEIAARAFRERGDRLGQGRCLLTQSSLLRRRGDMGRARTCLEEALHLFQQLNAPVYEAMVYFQQGIIRRLAQEAFELVRDDLDRALSIFKAADLSLWVAQTNNALAYHYQNNGRLREAGNMYHEARQIYSRHHVPGPQADTLLDSGLLEKYKGNYEASLRYFEGAEAAYTEVGNPVMAPVAAINRGEVYALLGRYQQALVVLEKAHQTLAKLDIPYRLAYCQIQLARVWSLLGRPEQTYHYLDEAIRYYQADEQIGFLTETFTLRAEIYFQEGKTAAAVEELEKALRMAQEQGTPIQLALLQRILAETLAYLDRPAEAVSFLDDAEQHFREMGMVMEEAACQVIRGVSLAALGHSESARMAWQESLSLSQNVMPDLAWQAYAGLAALAEEADEPEEALAHYRNVVQALARLRRGLWQPALLDAYLKRSGPVLDRAVALGVAMEAVQDVLFFVEESKAQILRQQLGTDTLWRSPLANSEALVELGAEIRWLQEKIRADFSDRRGWLRPPEELRLRQQLADRVIAYDNLQSRLEREQFSTWSASATVDQFDLAGWRNMATTALGDNWLALDYYLADDQLNTVLITPTDCLAWHTPMTDAVRQALRQCKDRERGEPWLSVATRQTLGGWLVPDHVQKLLTSAHHLIIAPHRILHRVPWSTLLAGSSTVPLVELSIPIIVPSLLNLRRLWQRPVAGRPHRQDGLLLGLYHFNGRRPALPAVVREMARLNSQLGAGGERLLESGATHRNLMRLARNGGLERYSFFHIATHAFHDPITGRLSGLALHDTDLWLASFQELGPLPRLVTLSACSGSQSRIYQGDEHVGPVTTCLAAGARSVVGSLWPVVDEAAADLMLDFYDYYLAGHPPAQALALAQRAAHQEAKPVAAWGSFVCHGVPA